jgi:hypothetical protein
MGFVMVSNILIATLDLLDEVEEDLETAIYVGENVVFG